jgi:hypothetical protein
LPGEYGQIVTAVAMKGYVFVTWSDGVTSAQRRDTETKTVTAQFAKDTTSTYTIEYEATIGGLVEGTTIQTLVCWGESTVVTAVASEGYRFVSWSDGNTSATRTDIVIEDLKVTAVFEKLPIYTITYLAGEGGTIVGSATQILYDGQSGEMVVASPQEGYVFVGWDDGLEDASRADAAEEDKVYTALFKEKENPTYTLRYTAGEGGRIEGVAIQQINRGEGGNAVTAIAEEGYRFVSWSDGNTEPTRADALEQDASFEAVFEKIETEEP